MKKLGVLVNSRELLDTLVYLYERWQDECRFESFGDYEVQMRKHVPDIEGFEFVEATEEPFGFIAKLDGVKYQVRLKSYKDNYWSLLAEKI